MVKRAKKRQPGRRERHARQPSKTQRTRDHRWVNAKKFSRHTGKPRVLPFFGTTNQFPFSNHAATPLHYKDVRYHTSEHAYMAAKARYFQRNDLLEAVRTIQSPKWLKSTFTQDFRLKQQAHPSTPMGRAWEKAKPEFMKDIVNQKFAENPAARDVLLRTGDQYLVEASPRDKYWGIGMSPEDSKIQLGPENAAYGENRLGRILMNARDELLERHFGAEELKAIRTAEDADGSPNPWRALPTSPPPKVFRSRRYPPPPSAARLQ
jgi:ribA/ribD-fused uncharacterized protein